MLVGFAALFRAKLIKKRFKFKQKADKSEPAVTRYGADLVFEAHRGVGNGFAAFFFYGGPTFFFKLRLVVDAGFTKHIEICAESPA